MGKKPTESADAKTDFWGNKKEADQKQITEIDSIQDKTNPKVVLDFWGNPMKEAEQTKNKQAQENKDPKAKVVLDFWGNPIKE